MKTELRYMERASARSLRVWLVHGWIADTPAVGPMLGCRLFGWSLNLYPWHP